MNFTSRLRPFLAILVLATLCPMGSAQEEARAKRDMQRFPDMPLDEALQAIRSPDAERRLHGAIVLYEMGPQAKAAVGPIAEILSTSDMSQNRALLHVLIKLGPAAAPAAEAVRKGLDQEDFHTRYLSCRVLGQIGDAARPAVPKLIELLDEPLTSVQRRAAEALGNLGPTRAPQAVDALIRAVQGPRHLVRLEAIQALSKFGDLAKPALPTLKQIADNRKSPERVQAAMAVMQLTGDTTAIMPTLRDALTDDNHTAAAAEALLQIATKLPAARQDLAKALEHPSYWVRLCAVEAIGKSGAAGQPSLAKLRQLLEDEEPDVREAAAAAISQIEAATAQPQTENKPEQKEQ